MSAIKVGGPSGSPTFLLLQCHSSFLAEDVARLEHVAGFIAGELFFMPEKPFLRFAKQTWDLKLDSEGFITLSSGPGEDLYSASVAA